MKRAGERRFLALEMPLTDLLGLLLKHGLIGGCTGDETLVDRHGFLDPKLLPADLSVVSAQIKIGIDPAGTLQIACESDGLPESCEWAGYFNYRSVSK